MPHSIIISKVDNGFLVEAVGERAGIFIAADRDSLIGITTRLVNKLSPPKPAEPEPESPPPPPLPRETTGDFADEEEAL